MHLLHINNFINTVVVLPAFFLSFLILIQSLLLVSLKHRNYDLSAMHLSSSIFKGFIITVLIDAATCVLPHGRYNGWFMEKYPGKDFLVGYYPGIPRLTETELGDFSYLAVRQMKTQTQTLPQVVGSNPNAVTVWQDEDNNLFFATSGGNSAKPKAHAEDNIIYASKSTRYAGIPGGLKAGKVITWKIYSTSRDGRKGIAAACATCQRTLRAQMSNRDSAIPKDIYNNLSQNKFRPSKPEEVRGYKLEWHDMEASWQWINIYYCTSPELAIFHNGRTIPEPAGRPVLAEGWAMMEDRDSGFTYYRNLDGLVQWEVPTQACIQVQSPSPDYEEGRPIPDPDQYDYDDYYYIDVMDANHHDDGYDKKRRLRRTPRPSTAVRQSSVGRDANETATLAPLVAPRSGTSATRAVVSPTPGGIRKSCPIAKKNLPRPPKMMGTQTMHIFTTNGSTVENMKNLTSAGAMRRTTSRPTRSGSPATRESMKSLR